MLSFNGARGRSPLPEAVVIVRCRFEDADVFSNVGTSLEGALDGRPAVLWLYPRNPRRSKHFCVAAIVVLHRPANPISAADILNMFVPDRLDSPMDMSLWQVALSFALPSLSTGGDVRKYIFASVFGVDNFDVWITLVLSESLVARTCSWRTSLTVLRTF